MARQAVDRKTTLASDRLHRTMTTPTDRETRNRMLAKIRQRAADADEINLFYDNGPGLEWLDPIDGERKEICRFDGCVPADQIELTARYRDDVRFLLELLDNAFAVIRKRQLPPPSNDRRRPADDGSRDYAAEASMACANANYAEFLKAMHGLDAGATDPEDIQEAQRNALKIKSKSELNAHARWIRHRNQFKTWMKDKDNGTH